MTREPCSDSTLGRPSRLRAATALALAILSLLPVANWIKGGHNADWYQQVTTEWASGASIAIGIGFICAILSRRLPLWREGFAARIADVAVAHRHRSAAALGLSSLLLYLTVAWFVFDRRPLLIDELVQVMQAKIFAQGRLSLAAPAHPEFFSTLHIVDYGGRWYSQFPPGGPLMLTLGAVFGAAWMVGPVCGAASVVAFWYLAPKLDSRSTVVLGATLIFGFAPFMVFMSGSHMNHVPTLMWSVLAVLLFTQVRDDPQAPWKSALGMGLCLGFAAAIRPVDGATVAIPIAIALAWGVLRKRRSILVLAAAGVGVAIPLTLVLAYNARTTGDPYLFGYELLWGKSHALGFHRAPWGFAHTPARGVELINIYLLRLQSYLFELPIPSLLPGFAALAMVPRVSRFDRILLAAGALLLVGYFAYWHDGFYLGPRFLFPLMPLLAIWTARFVPEMTRRFGLGTLPVRAATYSLIAAVAVGATASIPLRVKQYHGGLASMRLDYVGPAHRANVQNSLILVRESWGTQLVARLWALGVSRTDAETLYRSVDACVLEEAIDSLERGTDRDSAALVRLAPLLRDSSRVVKTELSPDRTERMLPGARYTPTCVQRISEDRAGFTLLAPIHALDRGTNIYARDLHMRDTLLVAQYPGRPLYLLRPVSNEIGAPLQLTPLPLDSLRRAWTP